MCYVVFGPAGEEVRLLLIHFSDTRLETLSVISAPVAVVSLQSTCRLCSVMQCNVSLFYVAFAT